ncbi:MAG: MFS transporter [Gemmatimonadetes bacterium]|nr:MFS transporter [Gemmatimonadota bacterium]
MPNRSLGPAHPAVQLTWLAAAMVFGMMPWFAATVVSGAMALEWQASSRFQAWLTMAVQLGFVIGTLLSAIMMLSDRWSPRLLAAGSAVLAGVATAVVTIPGVSPGVGLLLRGLTGAALAGVYPPGMKIAAGWWRERRGMAIGVLIGALTLGSAAPNLARVAVPAGAWREVLWIAALGAVLAGLLLLILIREGPYQAASQPFDYHALARVVGDRGVRLATGGYLGHMWELYAMWSAMAAFWAYIAQERSLSAAAAPTLAFATIAAGGLGCVVAGILADRWGRSTVTIVAMAVSGACCLWIGGLIHAPLSTLMGVALLWGFAVVADSAQFSACITELAPQEHVGTALTMQTCLGFLLTIVTIRLVPVWVDAWGWERAFVPLAIGPALGILSMRQLQKGVKS